MFSVLGFLLLNKNYSNFLINDITFILQGELIPVDVQEPECPIASFQSSKILSIERNRLSKYLLFINYQREISMLKPHGQTKIFTWVSGQF